MWFNTIWIAIMLDTIILRRHFHIVPMPRHITAEHNWLSQITPIHNHTTSEQLSLSALLKGCSFMLVLVPGHPSLNLLLYIIKLLPCIRDMRSNFIKLYQPIILHAQVTYKKQSAEQGVWMNQLTLSWWGLPGFEPIRRGFRGPGVILQPRAEEEGWSLFGVFTAQQRIPARLLKTNIIFTSLTQGKNYAFTGRRDQKLDFSNYNANLNECNLTPSQTKNKLTAVAWWQIALIT